MARIPAGGRRPLHPLGRRGRGRLEQPRGAAAAGRHRAVRLRELGPFASPGPPVSQTLEPLVAARLVPSGCPAADGLRTCSVTCAQPGLQTPAVRKQHHFRVTEWEDMAAHVGASRTPQEVMEHYVSMYIHGNLGKACIPDTIPNRVTDHTCPSGGPLSPSLTTPLPPLDISVAEQQQLGYMPLRDDYEIEYDQDAETLISGLSVNYDDDDVEIELKRAHVDMYVRKLKERQRRKNIARDYNLVPAFLGKDKKDKEKTPKRKITKEEKELRLKLRPLYQFMSCKEFEDFFENMHKERILRAKIRELQRYRRNGITKMEESAEYEAARHKREKRKENKNIASSKRGKEEGKEGEFAAIENLPGFELLSDREKVLCSSLNLSPARYLTVKTIIIKDHLQKRQGIPSKSRLPSYLDKVLKKRILNFLTESGWISRDAS
ncbi:PREDICTED: transcriptional adapter 2-beta isoform X1 [Lepidothrix coronata]|uniref:Transcriptional adapter 2-beta isoform X1 n=1 Tax=Lepidothrix coronata TaxID=321398 RepID=A0A6J0IA58_9PASS|nr:PREDICTED: transcriptional adapter 2-beta isoform X1 [Lepidothrix coronata]